MFDTAIAIARLDFAGNPDEVNLDALRARYPELGFVFDLLEDKLREVETSDIERRDEKREIERIYESAIDYLECRVQHMRLAFEQIMELTVDAQITQIVEDIL
jgi:hypothetical protein